LTLPISAAAHGGNPSATITFRDYPGDSSTPSDKIRSDFGGPYKNGLSGVVADFVNNGNVELNLTSSTRTVYLDFSTPDTALNQSLGLNPPNLTGSYRVNLSNNVDNANGTCNSGTGLLGMQNGASGKSCFWANFTDNQGNSWAIRFGHYNYPYTSDALATRSADGLSWTLESFPTDVAVLVQIGKRTQSIQGYFFMPGKLTITKP
jgi:hypothetical protein